MARPTDDAHWGLPDPVEVEGSEAEIAYAFNDFDNRRMYALVMLILVVVSVVNAALFGWERRLRQRRGLT